MEKLRKAVHQPIVAPQPHSHAQPHLSHSRLDPTHRHVETGAKGKSHEKNVCKICRQKRTDPHDDADDESLDYLEEDLGIRSAPAKLQQSHQAPVDQQHYRREEQTPLERRREHVVAPTPARGRAAVHRRGEDRQEVACEREIGGEKRDGVRSRVMREKERKKDEWIERLKNLKDEFLIHEK